MSRWSRGTGSHWEVEVEAEIEIKPAQHGGGKKKGRSLEQRAKVSADKPPMIAGGAKFTRFSPMTLTTLCRIQVTASPSTSFPNSCIIDADRFPDATVKDKQQHAAKVSDRLG